MGASAEFVFSGRFCCFGLEGGVSEFEIAADQRGNFRVKFFLRRLTQERQNLRLAPLSRLCHDAHQNPVENTRPSPLMPIPVLTLKKSSNSVECSCPRECNGLGSESDVQALSSVRSRTCPVRNSVSMAAVAVVPLSLNPFKN